jgi:hypothetical protein
VQRAGRALRSARSATAAPDHADALAASEKIDVNDGSKSSLSGITFLSKLFSWMLLLWRYNQRRMVGKTRRTQQTVALHY